MDPRAQLILGGLANFPDTSPPGVAPSRMAAGEYASRMVAHRPQVRDALDVVAVHPYAADPDSVLAWVAEFRSILDAGLGETPISVNEVGWSTQGADPTALAPVPETQRAAQLGELAERIAHSGCGVIAFAPHTWSTPETNPADNQDWFGIADPETGEPYATARAYADVIAELTGDGIGAKESATLTPCGNGS